MEKKILIVIDMINDFVKEGGALYFEAGEKIIPAIKKQVDKYRKNRLPIIFLCDKHDNDDEEFDRFPAHAIERTQGADIVNGLRPINYQNEYEIDKTRFDGFYNTDLDLLLSLHYSNINKVEIVGVCTSICVMETAGSFVDRNWDVSILSDCVADLTPENHHMALERMKNIYGVKIIN